MLRESPPERLRRRHVDGERVEDVPEEEVDCIRRSVRTLLPRRPARVAEGQCPDGARAGALMYALALYQDEGATLDDLRESVGTLEETTRSMRRVLGAAHPDQVLIEGYLRKSKAELRARETAEAPLPR